MLKEEKIELKPKGRLQSLTNWGLITSNIIAPLLYLFIENSDKLEALCQSSLSAFYAGFCAPMVGMLVYLAGQLATWWGRERKGDFKGLWRK